MGKLSIRSKLSQDRLDLLEAVGFDSDEDLRAAGAADLHRELVKANGVLGITSEVPTEQEVRGWIEALPKSVDPPAREAPPPASTTTTTKLARKPLAAEPGTGLEGLADLVTPQSGEDGLVDFEADPKVRELVDKAPLAVPISNQRLVDEGIHPAEIPVAAVLNRAAPEAVADATVGGTRRRVETAPRPRAYGTISAGPPMVGQRLGIDVSKVKHIEEAARQAVPQPPSDAGADAGAGADGDGAAGGGGGWGGNERSQLIRTAREETNRGKDPASRRFVRGVLHDRPWLVRAGCVAVLCLQLCIPLALLAAPVMVLADLRSPGAASRLVWLVAIPLALPLLGILYFTISFRVKCRVCGQRVLVPKLCLKHPKAHRIPALGHIFPLAWHTLLFHWFRCTYCGTSVRVKE